MSSLRLVCRVLVAATIAAAGLSAGAQDRSEQIDWLHWETAAFERAAAENKIILVSVGMEGCAACQRMESLTYTDRGVIQRVNEHFVAIEVDAEARPDIGERYSDWAWPATIFLAPDATQVLALRGNRLPRNFNPILDDLIEKHGAGRLEPDPRSPYAAPPAPVETEISRMRDDLRAQLDRSLNRQYGGWGRSGIGGEQSGSRLRHLYLRAHMLEDRELGELAIKSSAGFLNALDPVWGGVYIASFPEGMSVPDRFAQLRAIPEKRILVQANAITAFSLGYRHTGESHYLEGIAEVDRYLQNWMTAPDGTFYTNQKSEPPNLPRSMSKNDYWLLDSDEARRRFGVPPVDHAVYTDKNGEVIAAYVLAFEATSNPAYLETAIRAAEAIIKHRQQDDGWVVQAAPNDAAAGDDRMRPLVTEVRPFLSAQAWFGTALLALHRATGDERWLQHAVEIADATLQTLEDDALGGFFATVPDATAAIVAPRKPLEANGTAASFFFDLEVYTKDERYAGVAERAAKAVGQPTIIRREGRITGEFANALERLGASYVEFSIVGDTDHPNAIALFEAGRAVFEPRKILHFEAPGRYPDRGTPSMYICNPDMCSVPITDPNDVAKQASAFRGPASSI